MKTLAEILRSLEGLSDIELFVIDLFCGAGGLSEGVEMARLDGKRCAKVVCCVNHDKNAILSHNANIPDALHFIEDIRTLELSPIKVIVDHLRELYSESKIMLHASLECTNFSKAKGGQPRDADSRTLAEHLFRYIDVIAPDYIQIENVEEFMSWGDMDENGKPISMDKGRLYQKWVRNMKKYGYDFDHRILNAADYGAYTTRKRFFGIFAKKGLPIVFPQPTHASRSKLYPKGSEVLNRQLPIIFEEYERQKANGALEPWKAVKDVLDFSDEGITVFREKPLAEKTMERIYAGLIKFVAGGKEAFLIKYNSMNKAGKYQAPGIDEPCPVISTQGRLGVAQVCFLSKQFSGHPESKNVSVEEPAGAITCKDHHAFISAYYGGKDHNSSVDVPAATLTTKDRLAFVSAYYGNGHNHSVEEPAPTVTTKDRFSLIESRFMCSYNFKDAGKDINQPCPTILTKDKLSLVSPFFMNQYSGGGQVSDVNAPCPAVTTTPKQNLITCKPWIMNTAFFNIGSSIEEPSQTITANRKWHYLMNPQFSSAGGSVDNPCFTLIARMDKMPPYLVATETGRIAIEIYDTDSPMTRKIKEFMALYGIIDIKMRMLRIPELKRIMGFPEDYILVGTQADQKKFIGNAVEVTQAKKNTEALSGKLREMRLKKLKKVA